MFESRQKVISNQYPAWKYLLLLVVIVLGLIYAAPNLFGDDPAVQVSPAKSVQFDASTEKTIESTLAKADLDPKSLKYQNGQFLIRFHNADDQLKAKSVLKDVLGRQAVVALNLAPATPEFLRAMGAQPMYLGLDLRGGVHFLMDVDMEAAIEKNYNRYVDEIKATFRKERIRYLGVEYQQDHLMAKFRDAASVEAADKALQEAYPAQFNLIQKPDEHALEIRLLPKTLEEARTYALKQNITTLRNRINELGVAEPVIQQQGDRRIVVQLPGVQDTAKAKEILGATATLEFRLVEEKGDAARAEKTGYAPNGSRLYHFRNGRPILLKRSVIVTGDNVINAQSGIDPESGSPEVTVTLDGVGGRKMLATTKENIGNRMAVVFIENRIDTIEKGDETIKKRVTTKDVINAAVIRGQFANRFQITGLDSPQEAQDLALLLRAGALAAPMEIVEERTVGPSLGQDNIDQGMMSVVVGFLLVLVVMVWRYKVFGMIANVALTLNLVLIVAVLSLLQATLTLPGIAGIVLTVGMAVDANVLIFERIREELRNSSVQSAIHAGYEKAFVTIADANITTLLAAVVLFSFGTGPIKGFAITLSIGIITSMFTAILGTRALVNALYGNKPVEKLSV
ncbi:protein translocase subunit SecD [Hydrogenovibrio thermophilus]|jgi:protein-export membrane protein, SecD/SecF family/protein-export membrane protein SecD|uniref:Protein translocase subunit SecD n=1 Tax=Hydrogenovibrio thermophilus TaxID=265883 RepID=A0A410H3H3_9GAMM|nr:protein translocase subunit SecD [Hydrogenovibrio thermophilus]QAB15479.1 protein translocase subunit SecD [Hydrogenovibrio thermophilus]